jgi:hypothetical protein
MAQLSGFLQAQEKIAVSTSIQVLVNGNVVGAIQSLDPSQDRTTTPVRGIGTGDRILHRIWGLTNLTMSVQKFALYKQTALALFTDSSVGFNSGADAFRMLSQLRVPIDIHEIMRSTVADSNTEPPIVRQTIYHQCYMTSYGAPRSISGDIIITEAANFDITWIDDGVYPYDYADGITATT